MSYTAAHEILYRDELGQTARIDPGAELTKEQEEALAKDIASLVKTKAIKEQKKAPAAKSGDGFADK